MLSNPFDSIHSRRQAIAGAIAIAAMPLARGQQPSMVEKPSTGANQARTSIHYDLEFKPSPQQLYEAILDQKQFAAITGRPATIDPTAGGAFSMFGGLIVGRNIELVDGKRIVQAWRPTHWEPGVYSVVHFELKPRGAETALIFDHTGFPAGEYDSLDTGWQGHYWEPIRKYFA